MTRWCRWPAPWRGPKAAKLPPKKPRQDADQPLPRGIVLLPSMCQLIAKRVKTLKARKR
ncbi:MAG: hypothetical protein Ct9H300mP1_09470 [Planctomycetaceae bacterium]|nr:MAG: hypothetical protein Ct9H300mP1_09470 [Planctomycetaceae bacterium]